MHICFLCSEYPPAPHGGIGTFTRTLGRALVARGHDVTVVGSYPISRPVREIDEGVRVERLPHTRVAGAGFFVNGARLRAALRRIHRERPIDVVEGQENSLAMLPREFVAPRIIRMNGGHHFFAVTLGRQPRAWRSWIERRSFERADFICGVSRYVVDVTAALLQLDSRGVEVLPNPVDTVLFHPRPPSPGPGGLTIVFVGTVSEKKGVRQLVQAMPQILAAVPDARLVVIGPDSRADGQTGSYIEWLRQSMAPDVASTVTFAGRMENTQLPHAMANATVCVYPSHMEALPIAFLEGMAMGKPVVASKSGPGPEVIEHGVTGLLCDPHDPRSIAEQVVRILQNPVLARALGDRAWQAVQARFSIDVLAGRNEAWYRRCVEQHRSHGGRSTPGATPRS